MFNLVLLDNQSFWISDDVANNLFKSGLLIGVRGWFSLQVDFAFCEQSYIHSSETYFDKDDSFYFNLRLFKLGILLFTNKNQWELIINSL